MFNNSLWRRWEKRFEDEIHKFITPDDELVIDMTQETGFLHGSSDWQKAKKAWVHVYKNIDYELSLEWKEPRQTIEEGIGDCEDVTFLLASMFPNMGINESYLAIGDLEFPDGRVEEHTWNIVEGNIADATGSPEDVKGLRYHEKRKWLIRST